MKLLLIEDTQPDARLIREMLKEARGETFEVQHVTRLDLGLERLRQERFEVVLLDLGLPDSQGMQSLTATQETRIDVPILVLTGRDDERFAVGAVRAGAQDYLIKGRFDSQLLVRAIRYAVERKAAQEQVRRLNAELEGRVADRTAALRRGKELSETLNRINGVLHSTLELGEIMQRLVAEGAGALGSDTAVVSLRGGEGWTVSHVHGMPADLVGTRMADDEELHALVAMTSRQPVAVEDALNDERFNREHLRRHNVQSVLVVPLIMRNQPFGVIFFNYHAARHAFTHAEVSFAGQLAATAAVALENARLFEDLKHAEQALRQSEEQLRVAATAAEIGMWSWKPGTGDVTASANWRRLFGVSDDAEVTLETWRNALHPEDREPAVRELNAASEEHRDFNVDYRVVLPDGTIRWIIDRGRAWYNHEGKPIRMAGVNLDITQRKLEETNRALLTDVLRILNQGGELRQVIAGTLRFIQEATGFDAVGLRLREGEDFPYYEQNGFSEEFLREENFLCGKGGSGQILRDQQGRAVLECTCGLVLSGKTDCGMSCFTKAGSFWSNATSELLALPPEADPRTSPRNRCIHLGYESVGLFPVRTGQEIVGVLQLNDRRGGRFTPQLVAFYENLAQNIGLAIQRSIAQSALQKAQAELQRHAGDLEKTVQERTAKLQELVADLEHFSYTLVHDMRAPLRTMRSFGDIVTELCGPCKEREPKRYLHRIMTSAGRMDSLITDALSFTKAVRQELPLEPVDPGALLRGMLDTYPELQASKGDIRIEGKIPPVMGNEAGLTQCFSNLLGNAVKFVKPGERSQVRIWAERTGKSEVRSPSSSAAAAIEDRKSEVRSANSEGEWVRIWIEDKGIGIPAEAVGRVFDMFHRAHKESEGTGIGLALVRKVAHRMGGRVGVESEEGQGSRFWIELRAAGL